MTGHSITHGRSTRAGVYPIRPLLHLPPGPQTPAHCGPLMHPTPAPGPPLFLSGSAGTGPAAWERRAEVFPRTAHCSHCQRERSAGSQSSDLEASLAMLAQLATLSQALPLCLLLCVSPCAYHMLITFSSCILCAVCPPLGGRAVSASSARCVVPAARCLGPGGLG